MNLKGKLQVQAQIQVHSLVTPDLGFVEGRMFRGYGQRKSASGFVRKLGLGNMFGKRPTSDKVSLLEQGSVSQEDPEQTYADGSLEGCTPMDHQKDPDDYYATLCQKKQSEKKERLEKFREISLERQPLSNEVTFQEFVKRNFHQNNENDLNIKQKELQGLVLSLLQALRKLHNHNQGKDQGKGFFHGDLSYDNIILEQENPDSLPGKCRFVNFQIQRYFEQWRALQESGFDLQNEKQFEDSHKQQLEYMEQTPGRWSPEQKRVFEWSKNQPTELLASFPLTKEQDLYQMGTVIQSLILELGPTKVNLQEQILSKVINDGVYRNYAQYGDLPSKDISCPEFLEKKYRAALYNYRKLRNSFELTNEFYENNEEDQPYQELLNNLLKGLLSKEQDDRVNQEEQFFEKYEELTHPKSQETREESD